MITINDEEWEMGTPPVMLKAYLIEDIENGCGEYVVQTKVIRKEIKILDFIQEEDYFDNIPTVFFTRDNLEILLDFIDKTDIEGIYINQDRDVKMKLSSGIMLNMEIF